MWLEIPKLGMPPEVHMHLLRSPKRIVVAVGLLVAATSALAASALWKYDARLPVPPAAASVRSVAVDGAYGLVGSNNRANLFQEPPPNTPLPPHLWIHVRQFFPQPGAIGLFGTAVAIQGTRLAIGAPMGDPQFVNNGYVDIYERVGSTWTFVQKVVPSNFPIPSPLYPELMFGGTLLLQGDTLIAGAQHFQDTAGLVFVFERNGGTFVQTQQLKPTVDIQETRFGGALAQSGETLAIGRGGIGGAGGGGGGGGMQQPYRAGEVHVYMRGNGQYVLQQILTAPDSALSDGFGSALDLRGDRLVVRGTNTTYLFQRQAGVWSPTWQHATPTGGSAQVSVLLRPGSVREGVESDLFVANPYASVEQMSNAGRVLRFTASTTGPGFVPNGALQDPQPAANANFGSAIAASGDLLLVAAPSPDAPANTRVRVFERQISRWILP